MEERKSVAAMTIGFCSLFLGLFPGVASLSYGLFTIVGTAIFSATGYDATGLGGLFGIAMIVIGIIFSPLLYLGVRLLALRPKDVLLAAGIIALLPLIFGIIFATSWKSKIDKERQIHESYKNL